MGMEVKIMNILNATIKFCMLFFNAIIYWLPLTSKLSYLEIWRVAFHSKSTDPGSMPWVWDKRSISRAP